MPEGVRSEAFLFPISRRVGLLDSLKLWVVPRTSLEGYTLIRVVNTDLRLEWVWTTWARSILGDSINKPLLPYLWGTTLPIPSAINVSLLCHIWFIFMEGAYRIEIRLLDPRQTRINQPHSLCIRTELPTNRKGIAQLFSMTVNKCIWMIQRFSTGYSGVQFHIRKAKKACVGTATSDWWRNKGIAVGVSYKMYIL